MTLIVGLGNPGESYKNHRHNIGFMVVDRLIDHFKATNVSKSSFDGECYKSDDLLFLKPTTYMNLSGQSVVRVSQFYKVQRLIVIHDDLDLKFGAIKIKKGGSHGGHNGLRSIDSLLNPEYIRVRMGIGKPLHKSMVSSYVLSSFSEQESKHLGCWIDHSIQAIIYLLDNDVASTASRFNVKSIENVI